MYSQKAISNLLKFRKSILNRCLDVHCTVDNLQIRMYSQSLWFKILLPHITSSKFISSKPLGFCGDCGLRTAEVTKNYLNSPIFRSYTPQKALNILLILKVVGNEN